MEIALLPHHQKVVDMLETLINNNRRLLEMAGQTNDKEDVIKILDSVRKSCESVSNVIKSLPNE